jgi:hypothetical protein
MMPLYGSALKFDIKKFAFTAQLSLLDCLTAVLRHCPIVPTAQLTQNLNYSLSTLDRANHFSYFSEIWFFCWYSFLVTSFGKILKIVN